ncbi:MAG: DUF262 domain-containing protein [Clostridia bacterium]|nr:DUF262 domain-containing protein [Clostridia bacterium]
MSFNEKDDDYKIEVPKEERTLDTVSYDYSVSYIHNLIESKKIILEVPFQRKFIWTEDRSSQLIESLILNVPIPPIYFAEEDDGKWLVIDGLQRLNTIKTFFQNEFALKKLDVIQELNKAKYKDLPPKAKSLLEDGLLRVNVIKKTSHPDIKFDIFMRLNKGAVTLNYQELRNCMYRGIFNDLLKEIVLENIDFNKIMKQSKPNSRYLDVEFILRGFAISDNLICENGNYIIKNYKGKMVKYLNDYMDDMRKNFTIELIETYKIRFIETYKKIVNVFGYDNSFRDISSDNNKIYKAIMDLIFTSFEKISEESSIENKELIYELLLNLLNSNQKFRDSITYRTSDKDVLNNRIDIWMKELEENELL